MKRLREWEPDISNAEAEEMFATHCEFVNAKGARVEMDQTTLVRDTLELAVELEDVLALRHWIICVAPDGTNFVTTDDPVHLVCAGRRPANPSLWSPGFGDPNTTVQVPVGPRFLLMGLPYTVHFARKRLSRAEVAATNTDLALSARRFVYFVGPTFVQITYGMVVFLILVKGTTLGWLARTSTDSRNASSREEAAFGVRRLQRGLQWERACAEVAKLNIFRRPMARAR
jgi:hypothetical protein